MEGNLALSSIVLGLAAMSAAEGASASHEQSREFEKLLASDRYGEAAKVADALLVAHRSANPQPRAFPLYQAFAARLALKTGGPGAALPLFWELDTSGLAVSRAATLLDRAEAYASTGHLTRALADLETAEKLALTADQMRRLILIRASIQLEREPTQSLATLTPLLSAHASNRWEALLLASQANLLMKNIGEASALASKAWQDSPDAPARSQAPLRVALLRAAIAAESGNSDREMAMLGTAGAADNFVNREILHQLPVCGADGVAEDDWVRLALWNDTWGERPPMIAGASRPSVVRPFLSGLRNVSLFDGTTNGAGGTLLYLRCRSLVSARYRPALSSPPADALWIVRNGFYTRTVWQTGEESVNELAEEVASLQSRFGSDAPALIAPRMELLFALVALRAQNEDVPLGRIHELHQQVAKGLRNAGGPTITPGTQPPSFDEFVRLFTEHADRLTPEQAYDELASSLNEASGLPDAIALPLMESVLRRFPSDSGDIRRQALLLRLADRKLPSDPAEAQRLLRAARIPAALCASTSESPSLVSQEIGAEDYPASAIAQSFVGLTTFEFSISASGTVISERLVLASPTTKFGDAAKEKLPTIKYEPARRNGRPITCSGLLQTVRWRFPDHQEFHFPFVTPSPSQPNDAT